jgi:hypothetical protein
MTNKTILVGLVALAFVTGSIMIGTMAYGANLDPMGKVWDVIKTLQATDSDLNSRISASGVPIGTVLDYFCVTPCTIPVGYALADGSTVTDPASPLNGVTLPDLRAKFVRGANTLGDVGNTGGTISHTHSVDPPNTQTTSNGAHTHGLSSTSGSNGNTKSVDNCGTFSVDCTDVPGFGHFHTVGTTFSSGAHTHDLDIPAFDSASSENLPPYVDLVKIVRIK